MEINNINQLETFNTSAVEPHIIINNDRSIEVPASLQNIGVENDHDIETVTFDCPRYWDGHDFSTMVVYINYMRADGQTGCYAAQNLLIDTKDDQIIHFTWTLSREVTLIKGSLRFLVCIKKVVDGQIVHQWSSQLSQQFIILQGLDCQETIPSAYPDVITQILKSLASVEQLQTDMVKQSAIVPATSEMLQDVGITEEGKLKTKPSTVLEDVEVLPNIDKTNYESKKLYMYNSNIGYINKTYDGTLGISRVSGCPALGSAAATAYNGEIYIFGGYNLPQGGMANEIRKYNPKNNKITLEPVTLPFRLCDSCAVATEDYIYIFGGSSGDTKDTILKYNPRHQNYSILKNTLPHGYYYLQGIHIDDSIYLFGGLDIVGSSYTSYYSGIIKFDLATETCSTVLADLPVNECNVAGCQYGDYIYIFGGKREGKAIQKYNYKTNTCVLLTEKIDYMLAGGILGKFGQNVYIASGYTSGLEGESPRIYQFNFQTELCTLLDIKLLQGVQSACGCAIDDILYVIGGRHDQWAQDQNYYVQKVNINHSYNFETIATQHYTNNKFAQINVIDNPDGTVNINII